MQQAQTLLCYTKACYYVIETIKKLGLHSQYARFYILILINNQVLVFTIPTPNNMMDEFPQSFKNEQL